MIRTSLTALALMNLCGVAQAQIASQDVVVQIAVDQAATSIYVNRSTAVQTLQTATNGVDIIQSFVYIDFTLCVQGSTLGGYKLAHAGYNSSPGGQALGGISTGDNTVISRLEVERSPGNGSYETLTTNASSTTRAYGISCAFAAEPNTFASRVRLSAPSGTQSIAPDTYTGVLSLQVVPQ